ncbi:hypothetical protein SAMN05216326_11565 [Nitrosomonas marina]|uniref:Phosphate-selective porin O and P n=1 Tax=Nitrosomonas marina TaxID=917 RepID=A0A1I0CMH0_9PROT|nr:hypothetical protein [Nitrosomonas marina]SET20891.1 hypothetical protein SAMN05216326_11565 [Nitrosomonas marina]
MTAFGKLQCSAKLIVPALILAHSQIASGFEIGIGDWQAHGFVSQGYTYTSGNNFFGNSRNDGSFDFREIGINVAGNVYPNLLIAAQGLYRDAGGSDTDNFRLDFANLDYQYPINNESTVGIRLGRIKNPFGLYNDTRDVVWTRPSVTLPQSIYFDALALRQAMISSDGGLIYGRHTFGNHTLSAEFVTANPLDNTGGATEFLTGLSDAPGKMTGRPLFIGRAGYQWKEGRFRLLFSIVDLNRDFKSSSSTVPSGNVKTTYPLASAQINLEKWSFTAEYGQVMTKRSESLSRGIPLDMTSESFYVQSEYRFAPDWTALLRFDAFFADIHDRSGKKMAQMTGLPKHMFFSRDITFGLRWTFAKNFMVAADYHRVHGTGWLSPADNPDLLRGSGGDPNWDLVTVMFSYRF